MNKPRTGMIFDAGSIAEHFKKYNVNYENQRTWDALNLQTKDYSAVGRATISQNLNSSVEQAYNSYLQSQIKIASTRLGQGQKNFLTSNLQQATNQAYGAAANEALGYKQKLDQQVQEQSQTIESTLYNRSKNTASILNEAVDYTLNSLENNPELANDPLWSKYFVDLGVDALTDEQRVRYNELMAQNDILIEDAQKKLQNFVDPSTGKSTTVEALQKELDTITPELLYNQEVERVDKLRKELIASGADPATIELSLNLPDNMDLAVAKRKNELQKLIDEYGLLETQSQNDATLLSGKKDKDLNEFTELQNIVSGKAADSRRVKGRNELMLEMFDEDEEGNWNINLMGQDFFDQAFNANIEDNTFGDWLNEKDSDLYDFFVTPDKFDYRGAPQNQIRDMLGIGVDDYTYSFLERFGGMNKQQLERTFDKFSSSVDKVVANAKSPESYVELSNSVVGLMRNLGIDKDFEVETGINATQLSKGINQMMQDIQDGNISGWDTTGKILANLGAGAAGGAAISGYFGPSAALVGTIVELIVALVINTGVIRLFVRVCTNSESWFNNAL